MKQLTYHNAGDLQWQEVPDPVLSERSSALVRPFVAARSDLESLLLLSDSQRRFQRDRLLHLMDPLVTQLFRKDPFKGPFALGHECIAQVVDIGPDVSGLKRGQSVVVPSQLSCGRCPNCVAGLTSHCEEYGALALYGGIGRNRKQSGMLSDLILVPDAARQLIPVPDTLDPVVIGSASGNLTEAWSHVTSSVSRQSSKRILILGGSARSTALYCVAFAVSLQPAQVDYVDLSAERVAIAQQLGANGIESEFKKHKGTYDFVICGNSDKHAVEYSLKHLNPGGLCSAIHMPLARTSPVPLFTLLAVNLTLKAGLVNVQSNLQPMLEYLRSTNLDLRPVNTHIADFDAADQHFLKKTTKVIVHRPPL